MASNRTYTRIEQFIWFLWSAAFGLYILPRNTVLWEHDGSFQLTRITPRDLYCHYIPLSDNSWPSTNRFLYCSQNEIPELTHISSNGRPIYHPKSSVKIPGHSRFGQDWPCGSFLIRVKKFYPRRLSNFRLSIPKYQLSNMIKWGLKTRSFAFSSISRRWSFLFFPSYRCHRSGNQQEIYLLRQSRQAWLDQCLSRLFWVSHSID